MKRPPTVSGDEWVAALERLLVKDKELARARDALAADRGGCRGWRRGPTAGRVFSICSKVAVS